MNVTAKSGRRPRKLTGRMKVIYAMLILYCIFNVMTFLLLISGSLKGKSEIFTSSLWALPETPIWSNYVDAWNIGKIGLYTVNSVYVTGMSVVITIILASMASYVLGRINFKLSNFVMSVVMVGMVLPPFVIAIPLFDILNTLKLTNNLNGLIIVYVTKQLPFSIFVLTSFYRGLPFSLEEAATIDGASPFKTYSSIMLPLTMPAMVAVSINNLLNFWNEFLYALIFLTKKSLYTLPVGLFHLSQAAEYSSSWTILFAGMIISVVPILIIFAIFQKQFVRGVSEGAIKG